MGVETFNGDGFGVGWYDHRPIPGVYHTTSPAWSDRNLLELAGHIVTPNFLAHVRAATGTAVQQTNCHPFRYGKWLFVHNGSIKGYHDLRHDFLERIDEEYFPSIEGSTDSELMFFLSLTFGLDEDPIGALERMAGFIEATASKHGVGDPIQMTVGLSDGVNTYAARYASAGIPRSLFISADATAIRKLHPDIELLAQLQDEDRAIVSEPLGDVDGVWYEIPPSTAVIVQPGPDEMRDFVPRAP
jgi:glutamine amidotransferase